MTGAQVPRPGLGNGNGNPAAPLAGNAGPPTLRAIGQRPESGNGFPAGPLAQAVRGGANVGVTERPSIAPTVREEPAVEGPQGIAIGSATDVVKAQVKLLLQSPNLPARVKALKLAQHVATPDMSGIIAGAALIDSGLKEQVINLVQESEAYRRQEDAALQAKRTSNPNADPRLTDSEKAIILAGVLLGILEPLNKQTIELLTALYEKDPAATVDGLVAIYHRQQKLVTTNGQRITEFDAIKASCDIVEAALMSGAHKEPCLLKFADRLIEDGAFEEAANLIGTIGLPEGAERLDALMQRAGDQLARTTRLGAMFLLACAVIGTPECLPLLNAVAANPALHERMAETAAKILNIDLA